MKHSLIGIIFATLIATVFVSCRQGEKGDPGPAGTSSTTPAHKSGSITGQLVGTTYTNDSSFTLNLNYQYYKGTSDNAVIALSGEAGNYNSYSITRYDSTGNSYIKFEFNLDYYNPNTLRTTNLVPEIRNSKVTIVSNRKLSTNKMFYFGTTTDYNNPFNVASISLADYSSAGNSNITYNNIMVNSTTGLISFDYSLELGYNGYSNSTYNSATMNGSVSITPYNLVYRQAAQ